MSDLAVGTDDDLLLLEGKAQLVTGAAAVRQAWITHLTLFLGECFRDLSLGIDYQNQILDKNPSSTVLRAIYARASRETPGVSEVSELRFSLDNRTRLLSVTAEVVFDSGEAGTLSASTSIGGG
jgi:hypothetical protein